MEILLRIYYEYNKPVLLLCGGQCASPWLLLKQLVEISPSRRLSWASRYLHVNLTPEAATTASCRIREQQFPMLEETDAHER